MLTSIDHSGVLNENPKALRKGDRVLGEFERRLQRVPGFVDGETETDQRVQGLVCSASVSPFRRR